MATALIVAILALAAIAVPLLITRAARRGRRRYENVPPAMRPGYSDEQLEKSVVERYMGWGLVLTAIFAIFFPVYWVAETNRVRDAEAGLFTASVAAGEDLYVENCAECHGDNAAGASAPSPYSEDTWPAPSLVNIAERYEDNENIQDLREYVTLVLERGRPGTPMPPWSQAYQGPLTDSEIEDLVNWILVNQVEGETEEASAATDMSGEELFAQSCAQCHGEDGQGQVGPSLVGVFERHDEETVLGILRNGIQLGDGLSMPPFQNGYFYEGAHFEDEALEEIVAYLAELQPDELPEGAETYQTPGVRFGPEGEVGPPEEDPGEGDADEDDADEDPEAEDGDTEDGDTEDADQTAHREEVTR